MIVSPTFLWPHLEVLHLAEYRTAIDSATVEQNWVAFCESYKDIPYGTKLKKLGGPMTISALGIIAETFADSLEHLTLFRTPGQPHKSHVEGDEYLAVVRKFHYLRKLTTPRQFNFTGDALIANLVPLIYVELNLSDRDDAGQETFLTLRSMPNMARVIIIKSNTNSFL
jgi:hypothetical protein